MKLWTTVLVCVLACVICADASAAKRRRYRTSSVTVRVNSAPAEYYQCNDQGKCQLEANYMARHGVYAHVWSTIGRFEGWGCGKSSDCDTCEPHGNMTLTGDASAVSASGRVFRVRSWR